MVSIPPDNAVVAVCQGAADVETAIADLRQHGLEPGSISVVATEEPGGLQPVAYYFEDGCLRRTAAKGSWRLLESLPGYAVLVSPGVRVTLLAGSFASSVVRALNSEGLLGDLGPIAGGLYSLGIPRDVALGYERKALEGYALVVVHGRARDVARARQVLKDRLLEEGRAELQEADAAAARR